MLGSLIVGIFKSVRKSTRRLMGRGAPSQSRGKSKRHINKQRRQTSHKIGRMRYCIFLNNGSFPRFDLILVKYIENMNRFLELFFFLNSIIF